MVSLAHGRSMAWTRHKVDKVQACVDRRGGRLPCIKCGSARAVEVYLMCRHAINALLRACPRARGRRRTGEVLVAVG